MSNLILSEIIEDIDNTLKIDCFKCQNPKCEKLLKDPAHLPCDHYLCMECYKNPPQQQTGKKTSRSKEAKIVRCPVKDCLTPFDPSEAQTREDVTALRRGIRYINELKVLLMSEQTGVDVAQMDTNKENVMISTSAVVKPSENKPAPTTVVSSEKGEASSIVTPMEVEENVSVAIKQTKTKKTTAASKKRSGDGGQKKTSRAKKTASESTTSVGVNVDGGNAGGDNDGIASKGQSRDSVSPADTTTTSTTSSHSKQNVNLEKKNSKGETALQRACKKKNPVNDVIRLLEQGANPNVCDNAGWTPLHEAAQRGDSLTIEILLEHGANPNVKSNDDGVTPLHDAVGSHSLASVQALIKGGADIMAKDFVRQKALDYAKTEEIRQFLLASMPSDSQMLDYSVAEPNTAVSECPNISIAFSGYYSEDINRYRHQLSMLQKQNMFGRVNECFNTEITHLIVTVTPEEENVCARRSLKFLQAVSRGCWIVTIKWLDDSITAGKWLCESKYEVDGCAKMNPHAGGPKRARMSLRQNKEPPLFSGCGIFFQGPFDPPSIGLDDLNEMLDWMGGKSLKREPRVKLSLSALGLKPPPVYHAPAGSNIREYSVFIVRDPTLSPLAKPIRAPPLCTVTYDWLLRSIETWKLNPLEDE